MLYAPLARRTNSWHRRHRRVILFQTAIDRTGTTLSETERTSSKGGDPGADVINRPVEFVYRQALPAGKRFVIGIA